jgi:hypothetical protein
VAGSEGEEKEEEAEGTTLARSFRDSPLGPDPRKKKKEKRKL